MKNQSKIMALAMVTLLAAAPAFAADYSGSSMKTGMKASLSLTSLDKNKNGFVSRAEFRKAKLSPGLFKRIDKNRDGKISQAELDAYNNKNGGTNRVETK